jgi:hypothetical protein
VLSDQLLEVLREKIAEFCGAELGRDMLCRNL